jgi:hypothetical protein
MRGEFLGVRREIIDELIACFDWHEAVDSAFYHSIFRETVPPPKAPEAPAPSALNEEGEIYLPGDLERFAAYEVALKDFARLKSEYNDSASDESTAWAYFQRYIFEEVSCEADIVRVIEKAFVVFEEFGGSDLANDYFLAVERFLQKYSLRYDLRRPCSLHPTLPGLFSKLISELKKLSLTDANIADRLRDFEEALRDLKVDHEPRRIRSCVQTQMNLLEAIACKHPGITGASLGEMCKQFTTWPHAAVGSSLSSLYGFSSDFPGVRHGKASKGFKREVDMRDLVSLSIILAGFTPYLTDFINSEHIYSD